MNHSVTERPREEVAELTREVPLFSPRFDIVETENEMILFGDLPGVGQDQLDVQYENDQLIVHGHVEPRYESESMLRQEYEMGDFHRTFSIGPAIDAEKISAELHNGVLKIHLPKSEAVKPKRIEIKAV